MLNRSELTDLKGSNPRKQRIKSLCDNILTIHFYQLRHLHTSRRLHGHQGSAGGVYQGHRQAAQDFEKIEIESQLTGYSSAGCITYVELESSVKNNLDALEQIVNYAMDKDIPHRA